MYIYIKKEISLSKSQKQEICQYLKNEFIGHKNIDLVLIEKWTNECDSFETFFKIEDNKYCSNNSPANALEFETLIKDYKEI